MMKALSGTLPWLVVLAVLGGAIGWLLAREMTLGKWVLGGVLVAHGLVHVLFTLPVPTRAEGEPEWPFAMLRTWPVTAVGLDGGTVSIVGIALIVLVVGALALGGLSTAGIVIPPGWWPRLVGVGAGASAAVLLLFFNPQLVLGLGVDAVLLWIVVTGAWRP